MSQVLPIPKREPLELDARRISTAVKIHVIIRDKHCQWLGCEVATGLEVDHAIALALGGRDRLDNLQSLCTAHHKIKTRRDKALIAKAKRIIRRETEGPKPAKLKSRNEWPKGRKLTSRGFPKRTPQSVKKSRDEQNV